MLLTLIYWPQKLITLKQLKVITNCTISKLLWLVIISKSQYIIAKSNNSRVIYNTGMLGSGSTVPGFRHRALLLASFPFPTARWLPLLLRTWSYFSSSWLPAQSCLPSIPHTSNQAVLLRDARARPGLSAQPPQPALPWTTTQAVLFPIYTSSLSLVL